MAKRSDIEEALKELGFTFLPEMAGRMRSGRDYNVWQHPTTRTYYLVGKSGGLRTCPNNGKPPAVTKSTGYKPERLFRLWEERKTLLAQWGQAKCPDCDQMVQRVKVPAANGSHEMRLDKHHLPGYFQGEATVCPGTARLATSPVICDPPEAFDEAFDGGTVQAPSQISGQEGAVNDAPAHRPLSPTLQGHVDEFEDSSLPEDGTDGPGND